MVAGDVAGVIDLWLLRRLLWRILLRLLIVEELVVEEIVEIFSC